MAEWVQYPTAAEMLAATKAPAQPDAPGGQPISQVPSDPWDRIVVALLRAVDYLPRTTAERLRATLDLKTVQALAVILAAYAGFTIVGLGAIATGVMTAFGAVTVTSDLYHMVAAGKKAAFAEHPAQLEEAAKEMADAISAGIASW